MSVSCHTTSCYNFHTCIYGPINLNLMLCVTTTNCTCRPYVQKPSIEVNTNSSKIIKQYNSCRDKRGCQRPWSDVLLFTPRGERNKMVVFIFLISITVYRGIWGLSWHPDTKCPDLSWLMLRWLIRLSGCQSGKSIRLKAVYTKLQDQIDERTLLIPARDVCRHIGLCDVQSQKMRYYLYRNMDRTKNFDHTKWQIEK